MLTTISVSPLEHEQLLYQAVVDNEFRIVLLDDPSVFSMNHSSLSLPDSVEQQDRSSLEFWTEGIAAVEVYACASTCSAGPFTIVCDGNTK
jgi:hypothetical protein